MRDSSGGTNFNFRMAKGLRFPAGVGWQSSPESSLHVQKIIPKCRLPLPRATTPKRGYGGATPNTAETRQSLFKKQPARSQTGCRLLFVVDSADYLPRRPRPWFTIRWISAFISRMISRVMDCILVSKIAGTDCVNSPIIIPCLSKMLCPKGES